MLVGKLLLSRNWRQRGRKGARQTQRGKSAGAYQAGHLWRRQRPVSSGPRGPKSVLGLPLHAAGESPHDGPRSRRTGWPCGRRSRCGGCCTKERTLWTRGAPSKRPGRLRVADRSRRLRMRTLRPTAMAGRTPSTSSSSGTRLRPMFIRSSATGRWRRSQSAT
jgi:hypothetical protein